MKVSLDSIIRLLTSNNIEFHIDGPDKIIENMAAIDRHVENSLCYYVGDDFEQLQGIKASIVICKPGLVLEAERNNTVIYTAHPQLAFYYASSLFEENPQALIHNQTIIAPNAQIGKNVSIDAFCVIEDCQIGENVIIESGVRIQKNSMIGNHVRVQSGTIIGAAGYMWTWDENGNKISCAQTGHVIIEDHADIGSNITIVRGAFPNRPTIIGHGTMMAHGTMIGHGVTIGAHNHFANNVSLAGSVSVGEKCFFGSGAVVRPHIKIASNTIIGAGAVVVKDCLEEGQVLVGNPARPLVEKKANPSGIPANYS